MNFSISSSKALIFGFLTTLGVGVGLAVGSEFILRTKIAPQDEFISHVNLFNSDIRTDVAFGDSHVARGFVPPAEMVNLAYPSESIPRIAWKAQTYFSKREPGRVILQADPHMFAPYRLGQGVGTYPDQFENPLSSKTGLFLSIPRYRANLVNYWASFVRTGGELKSKISLTENGAHLSPGDISKDASRIRRYASRRRAQTHDIGPITPQESYREIYSKMLDDLKLKGARVCLVTFPVSPDFKEAVEHINDNDRHGVFEFFHNEAHRTNSKYVNWENITNTLSDFRDADHLNGPAAKRLSPELVKQCFDS